MASAPCSTSPAAAAAAAARVLMRSAAVAVAGNKKMTCLCSPTSHPGSFRCSRHRNGGAATVTEAAVHGASSSRGGTGRAAKGRSVRALLLQRIGGGGGGPGDRSRQRRHRRGAGDFQPRPSRLRLMNL